MSNEWIYAYLFNCWKKYPQYLIVWSKYTSLSSSEKFEFASRINKKFLNLIKWQDYPYIYIILTNLPYKISNVFFSSEDLSFFHKSFSLFLNTRHQIKHNISRVWIFWVNFNLWKWGNLNLLSKTYFFLWREKSPN